MVRVLSIDRFYALVTGQEDAFFRICEALPLAIEAALSETTTQDTPADRVMADLERLAGTSGAANNSLSMFAALLVLGFNTYKGFKF